MPVLPPALAGKATALVAEDEPLLRDALVRLLASAWPGLQVVAQARNGRQAIELFERHQPDICFLDVHMPGVSGVEAARHIGRRAQMVFVTAFDQYAVQAFERGALDYLVKPVLPARLTETVVRLQERLALRQQARLPGQVHDGLATAGPDGAIPPQLELLLLQLTEQMKHLHRLQAPPAAAGPAVPYMPQGDGAGAGTLPVRAGAATLPAAAAAAAPAAAADPVAPPARMRWIRASVGPSLRLIPVEDIDFLRSDTKYTLIAWRGDQGKPTEALIRTPLKELLAQLDATQFAQVHRSVVVNLSAISQVTRGLNETADIHLKGRSEVLPVSRTYLHHFRQM